MSFWKDKRVFVTGHTGFKGAWLCWWLIRSGAKVVGFSNNVPTDPSLFETTGLQRKIDTVWGDVREQKDLQRALSNSGAEVVFHMAAQSLVRRSYSDPIGTYATNVMGTVNLLESARMSRVRAIVIVTSDKCYENREWVWGYRENDPMGGYDPYSSSKACAELVTSAYRSSFFSKGTPWVASVRAGNVIGGGDWSADRLIPDMIRGFAAGQAVFLRNPSAVRPWQHVLDPLQGYLLVAEGLFNEGAAFAEAWNFAPDLRDTCSVQEVAQKLQSIYGKGVLETSSENGPHEAVTLRLDSSKSRTRLKWQPRLPLSTALKWIHEWHQAYASGKDMQQVTWDQLSRYEVLEQFGLMAVTQ